MHQSRSEKIDVPTAHVELWSVCDFARRYRLAKSEENRLLALFGMMASPHDLLLSARRDLLSEQ
ncbi:hypothetical protein LVY75_07975 (plasmid) [Sinorhizobium sp. B11]